MLTEASPGSSRPAITARSALSTIRGTSAGATTCRACCRAATTPSSTSIGRKQSIRCTCRCGSARSLPRRTRRECETVAGSRLSPCASPCAQSSFSPMPDPEAQLRELHRARWRIAIALTGGVVVIYFGFILLIAYRRDVLARLLMPGVSVGILLGALVIVASWLLTWFYVRWANSTYDTELQRIREAGL